MVSFVQKSRTVSGVEVVLLFYHYLFLMSRDFAAAEENKGSIISTV